MKKTDFIKVLFFFLIPISLLAQELPPIENFPPDIYNAGNQNWMTSQDSDNHIYIANNSGLLEYNGANWTLHVSPNESIIRAVKVIDELVYTGCYMEFGYWIKDEFGTLTYKSLIEKLNVPLIKDEHFWNILEIDNWVLFQSLDRIYLYNPEDEIFNIIPSKSTRASIFEVANSIYFQKINEGLFKIENGKAIIVSDDFILKQSVLVGAFSIDKKTLLLTETGEFFFLNNDGLTKWSIPAQDELISKKLYCSRQLTDGSFVLGTISNGVIQLDKDGNVLRKINKEKGLYNNTVLSVFEDAENNIWLGLDNGISLLNLNSPFGVYDDLKGFIGDVYTARLYNGFLYLGTNQGLFYKPINTDVPFKLIDETKGQVWCLKEIDNTLFCGHNNGTYIVEQDQVYLISNYAGTWDIKKIASNKNILLQGNYGGLSILEKKNDQWQLKNKIEGFEISSRFFEFITDTQVLVNHWLIGNFVLDIDSEYKEVVRKNVEESNGFGSSLVNYHEDILYTLNAKREVYKFYAESQSFNRDSLLTNTFYKDGNDIIGTLISEPITNKVWGFSNKSIICLSQSEFDKRPKEITIPISNSFRRNFGVLGFENITYLEDDLYLIGVSNGYITLDLDKLHETKYSVKLNAVKKEHRNAPSEKVSLLDSPEFKSDENNLNFSFSVADFSKFTEVEYQYQLVGLYDDWSSWFNEPNVSFENLPSGNYIFNIKGRNGNIETSNIESFAFSIDKPWYFTNVMLSTYIFVFLIVSFLIHRIYKRHYTVKHKRDLKRTERKLKIKNLNNERELMKIRNDNLRQDIENKNRELGMSTMSLIKKNEFLNSIKKELSKIKDDHKSLRNVIKIIDKNINNVDDWNAFQKAFNNVDKEFLKKIKSLHPALTSNDLRLCAYLRLNLSSKEIAPLFNISPKSVEVKRYRLRKKMDLSHELSLSNYILEI